MATSKKTVPVVEGEVTEVEAAPAIDTVKLDQDKAAQSLPEGSQVVAFTAADVQLVRDAGTADKAAGNGRKAVLELLIAHGIKAPDFSPKGSMPTIFGVLRDAYAQGLLPVNEYALWSNGAAAAKATGQSAHRNEITGRLATFVANMRNSLNLHWAGEGDADAIAATAKGKKSKDKPETGADAGAGEDATGAPDMKLGTIDPAKDRESFMAALNAMIIGTVNNPDKLIQKRSEQFRAVFAEMLTELAK